LNLSLKYLIVIVSLLFGLKAQGQVVLYQDIFRGGVTGGGYIPYGFNDFGTIPINIPPGSTIRKAFLMGVIVNSPATNNIIINGNNIPLYASNDLNIQSICTFGHEIIKPFFVEISDIVNFTANTVNIVPPQNQNLQEGYFNNFFVFIEYENPSLSVISTSIVENLNKCVQYTSFTLSNLNNINLVNDLNYTIKSTTLCSTSTGNPDGTNVSVNGINLGLIGGIDSNNHGFECAGVNGSIDYQNGVSYDLGDDTADNIMDSTDGTANIQSYLVSTNSIFFEFEYQTTSAYASSSNQIEELFLTYSTPCDTFSVSVPSDTTICRGASLQLNASGGSNYEWQPATDLSCSSCPNPVFTGDSTQLYTVRIWNNDSCSVVRPVKVKVQSCAGLDEEMLASAFSSYPNPSNGNFTLENEALNTAVLKVEVIDLLGKIHYSETINFDHKHTLALSLAAGTYILKVSDEQDTFSTPWIERIVVE
jgi:hypothetical protein